MLVLAGAGSGKTRVITYRVAHLLSSHRIPPYRIIAVTFTNKAAKEMRSRLDNLIGPELASDLWVGTFHATCARLLRRYHDAVGLGRDFVIYDESDQRALMARVLKALKIDDKRYPPKAVLSFIHGQKQYGHTPGEVSVDTPVDELQVRAYEAYQRHLLAANAVDFDDLIMHVARMVEDEGGLPGDELRRRFEHVLVDEFQDVNPIQYRLVRSLVTHHQNLAVVGDDDQSIYRWRGADVRIIRGFKHDFPGTRVVKLEQNYRSTENVVRAALGVIKPSREREEKELFTRNAPGELVRVVATRDERDEAAQVVKTIRQSVEGGLDPRQVAVFYRIHAQSRVLEEAMRSENVPYQIIGGTRFFDRAEIKNLLAYLRVLANPSSDVDILRIINIPARGIGQTSIDRIVTEANRCGSSIYEVIHARLAECGLSAAPRKRIAAFARLLQTLRREAQDAGPRSVAERVLEVTGYAIALARENSAEADARLENLRELLGSLEEYEDEVIATGEEATLSGYLERVSLVSDVDQMQDVARVSMMTVHAAKGLEFSLVLVTGAEEDLFPYRSSSALQDPGQLEEERRLAYVAFSRARDRLVISHAASRMIFGATRYCRPSRFLSDIPADVLEAAASPSMERIQFAPMPTPAPMRSPGERYVEHDLVDPIPHDDIPLTRGTRVVHKRFGEGQVRSVETSTTPPVVIVFFPGWGEKRILAPFLTPA